MPNYQKSETKADLLILNTASRQAGELFQTLRQFGYEEWDSLQICSVGGFDGLEFTNGIKLFESRVSDFVEAVKAERNA